MHSNVGTISLPIHFAPVSLRDISSRLYFGDEPLDSLFQGFKPRQVVYLYGSEMCSHLAEALCIRAQLPSNEGGVGSKAIFLDGGCGFNPSNLVKISRQNRLEKAVVLQNIMLSRAFTCFQMTNFIESKLKRTLGDTGSKLVVVSDFPSLYCDDDLEEDIGREQFCRALVNLTTIVKSENAIALIINSRQKTTHRMRRLENLLWRKCNIVANVTVRGSVTRIILVKHPSATLSRLEISAAAKIGLEDFLEAT